MTITKKEAARILDPETSQDALLEYEDEDRLEACNEACRVAAAALRAQTPKLDRGRWNWCSQCKPGGQLELDADCEYSYCPYCGFPLTEEAWADLARKIGGPDEN